MSYMYTSLNAVISSSDEDVTETMECKLLPDGKMAFTPEAVVSLILNNDKLRHPEYKEGDVTIYLSAADLGMMAQKVELRRVDSK